MNLRWTYREFSLWNRQPEPAPDVDVDRNRADEDIDRTEPSERGERLDAR